MLEETGFDISKLINKNDYIEAIIHDQIVRLYIIGYIPRETKFQPQTRNEIKACEWFPLADLPSNRKDMTPKVKIGVGPNAFFMVVPFVKRMRRWVAERSSRVYNSTKRMRHKSMGELESVANKNKQKISSGLQNEIQEYQNEHKFKNNSHSHGNQGNHSAQRNVQENTAGVASVSKQNTNNNYRKEKKQAKRQLFTPQNTQANFSPVQKDNSNDNEDNSLLNFVAPSWANFKFDRRAILDCLT